MIANKLEKEITLYKNQFEKFMIELFHDHRMDRMSLELDGISFRIKYMIKHNKNLDKIPDLKKQFVDGALKLRKIFGTFLEAFLDNYCQYNQKDLVDLLATDVKIDNLFVKFKMIIISQNSEYLEYINLKIPDNQIFNLYPEEYFRYYTDSYNDAISKAYPELFENKIQSEIGTGDDHDVFVHNFTFQTTENCNLACCFAAGTKILMSDYTEKNIEDIQPGDEVLSVKEDPNELNKYGEKYMDRKLYPTKVVGVTSKHSETICLSRRYSPAKEKIPPLWVTADHPFLTSKGKWKPISKIKDKDKLLVAVPESIVVHESDFSLMKIDKEHPKPNIVYNFETESHTYIANGYAVHNCYCYQFNKSHMRMDFETAKTFIDHLLNDDYGYINRYNSPAIIIEFIGGDPFLEIKLTRQIYEYFLDRCYELNHPWFTMHRLSICSNGLLYFTKPVQEFFKDYASQISFNISIDGNKELHDSCRVQPNGEGSYDIAMSALNHYNKHYTSERNSKMTLAPSNMKYLSDSVINFIENGMASINLNCVFEKGWNKKTAKLEYDELIKVADYLIDNNLDHIYLSIFNERPEDKMDEKFDGNSCGGTGSMLALRPNGDFYPCIRYMPTSVGDDVDNLCLGSVEKGFVGRSDNSKVLQILDSVTRRSQTNDICYDCPISNDCANCSGLSHALFNTPNKRTTFICIQMIAEALANVYYWNRLSLKHPEYNLDVRKNNVPDEWSLLILNKTELDGLKLLESINMVQTILRRSPNGLLSNINSQAGDDIE